MAKATPRIETDLAVTENEGAVLSLIARMQPVTSYGVYKAFQASPTASYNTSKGTVYPIITRLIGREFVEAKPAKGKRGGEELKMTKLGRQALQRWIVDTGPNFSFSHDPLFDRILSLGDVSREDRIRWIADAKASLLAKKEELNDYRRTVDAPYLDIVHGSAVAMIDAKLEWLDRLLIQIVRPKA